MKKFIPLKDWAKKHNIKYNLAHYYCQNKIIEARKKGGRIYVNIKENFNGKKYVVS